MSPKKGQAAKLEERSQRLKNLIALERHDGRDGSYFKHRLPKEVFLFVASQLEWMDLVRMSHVAVFWRRAILDHAPLWTTLEDVDVALFEEVDRVRCVAERSKGSLTRLSMTVNISGELALDVLPVVATTRMILSEISKAGAKNLEEIALDLRPFKHVDDIEPAYSLMTLLAHFVEFGAINLRKLKVESELRRFPSGAPFFSAMPSVTSLTLTSSDEEPYGDARLPEFLSTTATFADSQVTTCALRSLVLAGTSLMDASFPAFPNLRNIKLSEVVCSNLYGLLKASGNLERLWLHSVTSDPPTKFLPAPANSGPKDPPPPLSLPYLKEVQTCGNSPILWAAPRNDSPDFMTETPLLESASWGPQLRYDVDAAMERDDDTSLPAADRLSGEMLSNLFRNSPSLVSLNLKLSNATVPMLSASLPYAPPTLKKLVLVGTAAASNSLIDTLHTLTPNLSYLDVQDGSVTIPALARLASRRQSATTPRESFNLRLFADEPFTLPPPPPSLSDGSPPPSPPTPDARIPTLASITAELRTTLAALSPTQVVHLTSALVLNDPPGALPFAVCKAEVIALAHRVGGEDPKKPRLAATAEGVESARNAMVVWQRRREEEWAIEWCGAAEGVELVWDGEESDDDDDE